MHQEGGRRRLHLELEVDPRCGGREYTDSSKKVPLRRHGEIRPTSSATADIVNRRTVLVAMATLSLGGIDLGGIRPNEIASMKTRTNGTATECGGIRRYSD